MAFNVNTNRVSKHEFKKQYLQSNPNATHKEIKEAFIKFREEQKEKLNSSLDMYERWIKGNKVAIAGYDKEISFCNDRTENEIEPKIDETWNKYNFAKHEATHYQKGEEGYTDAQNAKENAFNQYFGALFERTSNSNTQQMYMSLKASRLEDNMKAQQNINFGRQFIESIFNHFV